MTIARPDGPLSRLLVLDLTQFLAGPYAGQIFGDLGARVIKIEPPGGEIARAVAPHFVKSAYYLAVNRNKESLALDLKSERGRAIILDIVGRAPISCWKTLCSALDCGELPADPRFRLNEDRMHHRAELVALWRRRRQKSRRRTF